MMRENFVIHGLAGSPSSASRVAAEEPADKMRIEARAPTRIDLAGGTLDIWPLYLFHQPAVTLNCAINLYASCTIETYGSSKRIKLISLDTRQQEEFASCRALAGATRYRLPLLAQFVKHFRPWQGLTVTTHSQAPAGAGISGSSALAVALSAAFDRLTQWGASRVGWIHLSRDIECVVLGVPTGTQDHYPAAFGGVSLISFGLGGEHREELGADTSELEKRLVLCYTGKPRRSGINNWKIVKAHIDGDRRVWRNLEEIAKIAHEMPATVRAGNWTQAGRLLREEWNYRRRNLPTISTPTIDRIIARTQEAGALGGKVCGAGGGGCLALLIQPDARARVEQAATKAGGQILPIRIDRRGVRVRRF
jgi:D-glycero-alpha-D-manno-heptose-7-phosphate kinase